MHEKVIFVETKSAVPLPHTGVKPRDDLPGSPFLRTNRDAKCLGPSFPDTFGPRSADFTGLKMIRITRAASFDHLVGAGKQRRRNFKAGRLCGLEVDDEFEFRRRPHGRFEQAADAADFGTMISARMHRPFFY